MAPSRAAPPLLSRTQLKYSRLNLNIDQHGELDKRVSLIRRTRIVSLMWWEKLCLFMQFLQFHGLMWLVAERYHPYEWRQWIRWTLWFNLDFAVYRADVSGSADFIAHTIIIMCSPYLLICCYIFINKTVYRNSYEGNDDDEPHIISHLYFEKIASLISEMMYIPCLLILFRLFTCADGNALHATSSLTCWSSSHIVLLLFGCILTIGYIVGLPIFWYYRCLRLVVFEDQINHERFLRSREIEYMMGVNTLYETTHFHLIASYRRAFVYWKIYSCFQKFFLVLFVFVPGPHHGRDDVAQSVLFFITLLIPPVIKIGASQYRVWSSNRTRIILDWTLLITALFGIFESNRLRSSFLVATTLSRILVSINCIGFGLFLLICLWTHFRHHRWPVTMRELKELCDGYPILIQQLNAGKRLLEEGHTTPDEFFPRQPVLDTINSIRGILRDFAAKRDGTFVAHAPAHSRRKKNLPIIDDVTFHQRVRAVGKIGGTDPSEVLEWTLQDMVEDLALMYNNYVQRTREQGEHAWLAQDRFQSMIGQLAGFAASQQRKSADRILMRPYQRDLLQKLIVVRVLLGDKFTFDSARPAFQPYPIVDGFSSDDAYHHSALDSISTASAAPARQGLGTTATPQQRKPASPIMEMATRMLKKKEEEEHKEEFEDEFDQDEFKRAELEYEAEEDDKTQ